MMVCVMGAEAVQEKKARGLRPDQKIVKVMVKKQ